MHRQELKEGNRSVERACQELMEERLRKEEQIMSTK